MQRDSSQNGDSAVRDEAINALDVLASEHRIAILRVLAEADEPTSFSRLRKSIGMRDTGQFTYHLSKLLGRFVRETSDGYELGHAGERVILAAADLDPDREKLLAETGELSNSNETGCPVCGDDDCDRRIHVHLSTPTTPVDTSSL